MVSVVIPAYNESASVKEVVEKVKAALEPAGYLFEIIVVDDGSTDGTAAALVGHGLTIITHPENKGYARTAKAGPYCSPESPASENRISRWHSTRC